MKQQAKQPNLIIYEKYAEPLSLLTDEDFRAVVMAAIAYNSTGETPKLEGMAQICLVFIKADIDANLSKYEDTCKRNTEAINKRWHKDNSNDTDVSIKYGRIKPIPEDTSVSKNTNRIELNRIELN